MTEDGDLRADDSSLVFTSDYGFSSVSAAAGVICGFRGSLFQYANDGWPLYRGEQRVYQAHPYDEEWGKLLDKRFWAD